ncbi:hypothetical protein OUZ56_010339 [Daphnia magna]|uniref:Uncharacterized protein n=1 Tax=Daphnia magna TaxID=35525 RepID=A0ABR0AIA4_9CRUS|nr:hypothetical protein OUZ56_010339 [Daphnia magna]
MADTGPLLAANLLKAARKERGYMVFVSFRVLLVDVSFYWSFHFHNWFLVEAPFLLWTGSRSFEDPG